MGNQRLKMSIDTTSVHERCHVIRVLTREDDDYFENKKVESQEFELTELKLERVKGIEPSRLTL